MKTIYPETKVRLLSIGDTKLPEKFIGRILQFVRRDENGVGVYIVEFKHLGTKWTVEASDSEFSIINPVEIKNFQLPEPIKEDDLFLKGADVYYAFSFMLRRVETERVYKSPLEHYATYENFVSEEDYKLLKNNYIECSNKILAIFKQDLRLAFGFFFNNNRDGDKLFDAIYDYIEDKVFEEDFIHYEYYLADFVKEFVKLLSIFNGFKVVPNDNK